jgi:hypothetical protein
VRAGGTEQLKGNRRRSSSPSCLPGQRASLIDDIVELVKQKVEISDLRKQSDRSGMRP